MKIRAKVLSCLICVVVLSMGYEYTRAESKADMPASKIGVVSVRKIFQDCKRNARYREEAVAERDKMFAKLEKLSKEIEAEEAGLKTLKPGSSDYLALMKGIFEKQASLQAQKEFYKQQMALKERRMVEELYKDILQETSEVAKQKGLDLVFERSEPMFPALSSTDLTQTISTHKLLYSSGCLDITDEVTARLDKEN